MTDVPRVATLPRASAPRSARAARSSALRGTDPASLTTSKAQTTIPQPVRSALHLRPGDELAYVIEEDKIILKRAERESPDNPFALFTEWDSPADREAYADL